MVMTAMEKLPMCRCHHLELVQLHALGNFRNSSGLPDKLVSSKEDPRGRRGWFPRHARYKHKTPGLSVVQVVDLF